jgi:hypothetical protein
MNWLRRLFSIAATPRAPRQLALVRWGDANTMLLANVGWRLAPEEDSNRRLGWVYLERDLPPEQRTLGEG